MDAKVCTDNFTELTEDDVARIMRTTADEAGWPQEDGNPGMVIVYIAHVIVAAVALLAGVAAGYRGSGAAMMGQGATFAFGFGWGLLAAAASIRAVTRWLA